MRAKSQRRKGRGISIPGVLAALLLGVCAEAKTVDVSLDLVGGSAGARPLGATDLTPPSHFLSQARTIFGHAVGVSGFQQLAAYREVYPGISMACYGDEHHFEYSFVLKAGADPSLIRLQLNGVKSEGTADDGNVVYSGDGFEAYEHAPVAFHHGEDGTRATSARLILGADGESSIATPGFSDEHRDELNGTRLSIVSGGGGAFGPDYDFYMSKYETSNEQIIGFLNDAQANQGNARGENMFFDEHGNVWINPEMSLGRDEMFKIDASRIQYDPTRVAGDRYHHVMDDSGREPYADHPATGVSWFGAVKYCNWLTLQSGRGPNELCYSEGTNTLDWAPVTATNWSNGFFSTNEREEWLKRKGFRLPMFHMQDGQTEGSDEYNEFLKAGSWIGHTNVLFGYGRNSYTNLDANALDTAMIGGTETLPVGYFDGLNPLLDGRAHYNANYYGIHDLSGNVAEWVNDPARPGVPDARSACGGSYGDRIQPLAVDRIVPPNECGNAGGFRPVTTYMPDEYIQVNILYCFHSPNGIPEAFRDRFGTQFDTMRSEKAEPSELLQPGGGGGAPTAGETPDEGTDEGTDEDLPARLDDGADGGTTDGGRDMQPPGIIYKNTGTRDETGGDVGPPGLPPPTGGRPPDPPPPPPPPPPLTYQLGVYSENPDAGVAIAVNVPDVNNQAGGATGFGRYYYYNTQVTVTAPTTVGDNTFKWWLRNGVPFSTANSVTVNMLSDLDLTAVYEPKPLSLQRTLTVDSPAGHVPVKITPKDSNNQQNGSTAFSRLYDDGETVTATAPASFGGENFQGWLRNGIPFSKNTSVTVTMLSDVRLTATYGPDIAADERVLTVTSSNPDGGVSVGVSLPDNNGQANGDTTFQRIYDKGAATTLTAPTTVGDKTFSHWLRNGTRVSDNPSIAVTMLTDVIMTAVYVDPPDAIILTVNSDPHGGVPIAIGTPDKDGAAGGNTRFTRRYDRGAVTTVTAPPDIDGGTLLFKNWLMNGIPLSTSTTINISLLADTELTAVYRPEVDPAKKYNLVVQSRDPNNHLDITVSVSTPDDQGNSDDATTFTRIYEEGTETTLTAPEIAPNGYVFDYWMLDGVRYTSNRAITIAMYNHHIARAVYKEDAGMRHVLTVESRNPDSSVVVTIDNPDVNNQQNGSTTFTRLYEDGEVVTLTARNPAFPGTSNTLKQWLLDGTPISTNATITVTMLRDTTVTALYGPDIPANNHTLTVESVNPGSGVDIQISQTDLQGNSDGSTAFQRLYEYATPVTATAPEFAPNGNRFQHWLINGQIYSKNLSIDISVLGDVTITAVYDIYLTHTLTVDSRNPGSGVDISVSNGDINNNRDGTTHFERIYEDGESVTLVAPGLAPNGRDIFKRWERNGAIITTNATVNLTMYSDIGVTAVYGSPNTFDLVVKSDNPSGDVNVSIGTPDVHGDTDGMTTFTRTYNPGEGVTVTAEETTSEGTVFQEWLLNGQPFSSDRSINITMLSDVELTAVYGPAEPDNRWLVVRSANPDAGVTIGVTPEDQRHFTDGQTAFVRLYQDGDVVTVNAPPAAGGNDFQQWILNGSPFSTNLTETITMYQNHEMIAVYGPPIEPEDRTLVVDSRNPNSGVPISVSQPDKNGNANGDTVFVRTYTVGTTTTLTAPEQGGTNDTYFLYWELNGVHYSGDRTVTIEMLTDQHLTAVYGDVAQDVTLIVNARDADNDVPIVGVVVNVAPVDLNGDSGGETEFQRLYENGQMVTLTAPGTGGGLPFKWWERDGTPIDTNQTVSVELLSDVTMTAVYGEPEDQGEFTLTVTSEGPDGGLVTFITASPDNNANAGGSTTFDRVYDSGTEVTLTAPSVSNGYVFDHWEIDGTHAGNGQTLSLALLSHVTATAVYKEPPKSQTGL